MPNPKSLPDLPEDYTSKFFFNDVVTKLVDDNFRGHVLRCWADEDDMMGMGSDPTNPIERPLLRGEVGIRNMRTQELLICPESSVVLFHRAFINGDIVKRSLTSHDSAVIIDQSSEVLLEHLGTKKRLNQWIQQDKLRSHFLVEVGDKVVSDNWLGSVESVIRRAVVKRHDADTAYRVFDLATSMDPGRALHELMPRSDERGEELLFDKGDLKDIVLSSEIVSIRVAWHVLNQKLPISAQDDYPEPPKQWTGDKVWELIHFAMDDRRPVQLGDGMFITDRALRDSLEIEDSVYTTRTDFRPRPVKSTISSLKIVGARSKLTLRWQNGSVTTDWASDVVPYQNVDEYETWPGDCVIWKGDSGQRIPAVVQTFDAHNRVADVFCLDGREKPREIISALELDPGLSQVYGVGIGSIVLLCDDNGAPLPEVPSLGQGDYSRDLTWETEVLEECRKHPPTMGLDNEVTSTEPIGDPSAIDWWGEVKALKLDGTVEVRLANGSSKTVGLKNIYLLRGTLEDEIMDPLEDMPGGEGMMMNGMPPMMISPTGHMAMMIPNGMVMGGFPPLDDLHDYDDDGFDDGHPEEEDDSMGSDLHSGSETFSEQMEIYQRADLHDDDCPSIERDAELLENLGMEVEDEETRDAEEAEKLALGTTSESPQATPSTLPPANGDAGPSKPRRVLNEDWQRFDISEEAPADHHFIKETVSTPERSYLSRVNRELTALRSSLPENILVRTYENRTDLVRCLIIGPEGTPYANAPFVFDVFMDPTKFPREPPKVHFHSHTNGQGRCNPNLYEDGKVCLSVLGTWSGDKSESWNPRTSSLLQVFVSISGLVLVRSPYHCEPAFAKLEGTREGRVNSRHYSEKAYVLSRSFVRTALQRPPTGFEDALRTFYYDKGRLKDVIDHAKRLIDKTEASAAKGASVEEEDENAEMWNADAIGSLTVGASLTLKRTISSLQTLWEDHLAKA
ncbi:hypothetical protein BD324DRAFT_619003 [Kockovaella imperatae]|uniref:UBC core domain-containing protein n=1 Tax=Kockovaella imperatae TaxID=4999 RepID=A0A1Y1UMH1_9TREE|nr:hypothetical protein BD324DRAFT_619003 [Kockovaella imperatae]ORX39251.1 hypothetical protein BD324DRAFT_619003 [Kockovaella imperatae]